MLRDHTIATGASLRTTHPAVGLKSLCHLQCYVTRVIVYVARAIPQHPPTGDYRGIVTTHVAPPLRFGMSSAPVQLHDGAVDPVLDVVVDPPGDSDRGRLALAGREAMGSFDVTEVAEFKPRVASALDITQCLIELAPPPDLGPAMQRRPDPRCRGEASAYGSGDPADRLVEGPRGLREVNHRLLYAGLRWQPGWVTCGARTRRLVDYSSRELTWPPSYGDGDMDWTLGDSRVTQTDQFGGGLVAVAPLPAFSTAAHSWLSRGGRPVKVANTPGWSRCHRRFRSRDSIAFRLSPQASTCSRLTTPCWRRSNSSNTIGSVSTPGIHARPSAGICG
jgi:hypothetical protein